MYQHISLTTLTHLVPLYPTHHRTLQPSLSTLSFRLLSGSSTTFTPSETIEDACGLQSVLHFTGGKAGSALIWRKSLDTAIANTWSAFGSLRTTFPQRKFLSDQRGEWLKLLNNQSSAIDALGSIYTRRGLD